MSNIIGVMFGFVVAIFIYTCIIVLKLYEISNQFEKLKLKIER